MYTILFKNFGIFISLNVINKLKIFTEVRENAKPKGKKEKRRGFHSS